MRFPRHVRLGFFFAGLGALGIGLGLHRLRGIETARRADLVLGVERWHADRALAAQRVLEEGRRHAEELAGCEPVRAWLAQGSVERAAGRAPETSPEASAGFVRARAELARRLASFPDLAAVALVGPDGAELLAAGERGALDGGPGALDSEAPVDVDGRALGAVIVRLRARAIEDLFAGEAPVAGASTWLVDASGRSAVHGLGGDGGGALDPTRPEIVERLAGGRTRLEQPEGLLLARPVAKSAWLVLALPEAALAGALAPYDGDAELVLVSVVLLVTSIGYAGVFAHRLWVLRREQQQIERYLDTIEGESAKVRALLEGAADFLLIAEPHTGRVRECNALARERLGLVFSADVDSLSGAPGARALPTVDDVVDPADRETLRQGLRRAAAVPGPSALPEIRVRAAGGETFVAGARLIGIRFGDEQMVEIALRDLTVQKEMERRLQIQERLSSVGLLTAGVAHEINNPLEGIGNYLALLEREGLSDEARARYLGLVRHGFARIRDIVRDLLRFARPDVRRGSADLAEVVARAVQLASYSAQCSGVRFEVAGLETPLAVVGDPGRLEQVFVNLLLNAGKAMGSRGAVRIRARPVGQEKDGRMVEISVADEGPGIPEKDLDRIFDPFFTSGEGVGLGLAISYGIVRAHGGTLTARNRESGGAVLTVRLPWPTEGAAAAAHDE